MNILSTVLALVTPLLMAPLLYGIINRIKAYFGGRKGRPLLQLYYDIYKLWGKESIYPHASSWVFRITPVVSLTAILLIFLFLPFGNCRPVFYFTGDFILVAGLLALVRFCQVLGALDTGSAFEGMGAAREALFGAMAEPIFLLAFACLSYESWQGSLFGILGNIPYQSWLQDWPFFILLSLAFFLILLVENCRIPADDPNTHLELTMIHEVMILDYSGAELAIIEYASSLKLWIFCQIIASLIFPTFQVERSAMGLNILAHFAGILAIIFILAAMVGIVESIMARLRMERVPQLLTLAASFTCLAALLLWS